MSNIRAKLSSFVRRNSSKPAERKAEDLTADLNVSTLRHTAHLMALEPRIALDAAAVATGIEVLADQPANVPDQPADAQIAQPDGSDIDSTEELADALVDSAATTTTNEIVFIDSTVDNFEELLTGIDKSVEVVILDPARDGVEQIAEVLAGRSDIDAVHIIAHGDVGQMQLGNTILDSEGINGEYADELRAIGNALTESGDILIYGCEFGEGDVGAQAVAELAEATGADIAASNDDTGSADLGGDWDLEVQSGEINTEIALSEAVQQSFDGILPITITNTADATVLADAVFGSGVTILDSSTSGVSDPNYAGTLAQAGTFTGGLASGYLSFEDGAIFSTGNAADINGAAGGNSSTNIAGGVDGDADFNAINGGVATFDASFLEATIIPSTDKLTVQFVFGSEEYNEYVYSNFNDQIGIWVNGIHYAATPDGQEIGIGTINRAADFNPANGSDANDPNSTHDPTDGIFESALPSLYRDNSTATFVTEMDGFTVTVSITIDVVAGQQTDVKIGLADTGDAGFDSWLLIKADSFDSETIANKDEVITNATTPVTFFPMANDTDGNNQTLTLTEVLGTSVSAGDIVLLSDGSLFAGTVGSLTEPAVLVNADGSLTVYPTNSTQTYDSFTYTIQDTDGNTATGMVSLIVSDGPSLNLDPNNSGGGLDNKGYDALFDRITGNPVNIADSDVSITDLDDTELATLTIKVTGIVNGNSEIITIGSASFAMNTNSTQTTTVGGTTFQIVYDRSGTPDLFTITRDGGGDMPIPDLEALIASIQYDNNAGTPTLGVREFDFIVSDGTTNSNVGESTVTIIANNPPVAVGDSFTTPEEQSVVIVALSNDTDADGQPLSISEIDGTAVVAGDTVAVTNGSAMLNANGTITFTPNTDYTGAISFTYTVTDGAGTDIGIITGTVTPINDAPVGVADVATTAEDTTVSNINVLGNDTDVDGDTLTVSGTPTAANGTVTVNPDDSLNYTPDAGFVGSDTITYTVSDGSLTQNSTVSVIVQAAENSSGGLFDGTSRTDEGQPPSAGSGLLDVADASQENGRSVVNAVRELGNLGHLSNIDDRDRFVLDSIDQIENLNGIANSGKSNAFVMDAITRFEQRTTFDRFVTQGIIETSKFNADEFTGFSVRWSLANSDAGRGLDTAMLHVLANGRTILLQVSEIVDAGHQIGVKDYSLTLADGRATPDWLVKGEKGLIVAELPADVKSIDIKLSIVLENGDTMTGYFSIKAGTGEISEIASQVQPEQFGSLFSEQLLKSTQLQDEGFVNLADALSQN